MKKFILWAPMLLMAMSVLATDKPKERKSTVDSGSFGIYINGKRVGTEKFTIDQLPDEGIVTADIDVEDGANKSEQSSELRVGADGNLKSYKWHSTLPTREESIVEPKDEFLMEHVTTAEQKKRDVPYVLPLSTVILDDNFFSQRELLIWRYLATGCLPQNGQLRCAPSHFGILIPHQHSAGSTVIQLIGRDKVTVKGAERELNKVQMDTDGILWLIWVDDPENHYKVIKMSIPSSNVEVIRD